MDHAGRLAVLMGGRERPLLVTSLTNIRYLTGFTGSNAFLVVGPDRATFLTDGRYGESAGRLVGSLPATDLVVYSSGLHERLAEAVGSIPVLDLEAAAVSWDLVGALGRAIIAELVPTTGVVERLRRVKDADEVDALRRAAAAGDAAFASVTELRGHADTEWELGERLVGAMQRAGAGRAGWDPIVALGANAAMPHHRAGDTPLGPGVLLLDYGCVVEGYHSDMSRTLVAGGSFDAELEAVYQAVLESADAGIAAVAAGATGGAVDAVCRRVLARHGYEEQFLHSTGHGVGLEIHEAPSLRRGSEDVLVAGDVVAVEPGVYLQGRFGVRIEDMVLVTENGPEVLTTSPRTLRSIR
jgi:Xaa-Pro dipeptidase